MKFPKKPNAAAMRGATIFTAVQKINQKDLPDGSSPFTDSGVKTSGNLWGNRDVSNLTARTLYGEKIPPGKDKSVMADYAVDKKEIRALNPETVFPDVQDPKKMLRDLPIGDVGQGPMAGFDAQSKKLNGQ